MMKLTLAAAAAALALTGTAATAQMDNTSTTTTSQTMQQPMGTKTMERTTVRTHTMGTTTHHRMAAKSMRHCKTWWKHGRKMRSCKTMMHKHM